MQCPQCQQTVEPGASFCANCGFKLASSTAVPIAAAAPAPVPPVPGQNFQPAYAVVPDYPALAASDHSGKAIASFVLGVLGLPACVIPILGIVFGVLAIIFGTLAVHSARKVFAIIGMSLATIVLLASIFLWVHNTQEYLAKNSTADSLPHSASAGDLQSIDTPCYNTKVPKEMRITHTGESCTFLGVTKGGIEQEEVKVLQVPGLTEANLSSAAKADAANVIGSIPGGSIGDQRSATFAGSQAYQIEILSTDGSAGTISYVYNTTAQGNLVIVLHTQAHAVPGNYDLKLIESNWSWL